MFQRLKKLWYYEHQRKTPFFKRILMMNEHETARRKCYRLKVSHILIILLTICVGVFAYYRLSLKSRLQAKIDAIRADGYPVTCAELDKWYTIPENTENAAYTFVDAFWCYRDWDKAKSESLPLISQAKLPARTEPLPEDMKAAIAQYIADNNEALALLHKAAAIENCRYPVDLSSGFDVRLEHLSNLRKGMRLLTLEAIWHAENGNSKSAFNSVMSGFGLARSLTKEPIIVSQLVRTACHGLVISGLERAINRTEFTDEQLAEIDRFLIGAEDHSALARAYAGERCQFLNTLTKSELLKSAITNHDMPVTPFLELYKAVGLADMDAMIYLDFIDAYIEITRLPLHQRQKASDALEARLTSISNIHVLLQILMPSLSRIATIELRDIARLLAARTGLAVERYRLADGKLPDSLTELVPAFLESIPKDPFDGRELRYKKLETGFVVYSIGDDLSDDGGKERERSRTKEASGWDVTFIVER
jgi:hypothetical protein